MSSGMEQYSLRLQNFEDLYTDCISRDAALQQYVCIVKINDYNGTVLDLHSVESIGLLHKIALLFIELNRIWTYFCGPNSNNHERAAVLMKDVFYNDMWSKVYHVANLLIGRLQQCWFWRSFIRSADIKNREVVISKISEAANIAEAFLDALRGRRYRN